MKKPTGWSDWTRLNACLSAYFSRKLNRYRLIMFFVERKNYWFTRLILFDRWMFGILSSVKGVLTDARRTLIPAIIGRRDKRQLRKTL